MTYDEDPDPSPREGVGYLRFSARCAANAIESAARALSGMPLHPRLFVDNAGNTRWVPQPMKEKRMIDNYIRFMNVSRTEHLVCFDSRDPEDIERAKLALKQNPRLKAVIWKKVAPFEYLPEVGRMGEGLS